MRETRKLRRGIYLMPTLFTVGNMFCGFASIVQASLGNLELAAALIVLAAVLDGLDGRIARLTGTSSPFGLEFDSLADVVSFGIAPAVLAFHWGLHPGRIGWSMAFLYVVCTAMRLARFNIQPPALDKRFFVGLPSPMAAFVLAGIAYAFPELPADTGFGIAVAGLMFLLAVLMVSRVRYRSFREIDLRNRRSYVWVLPIGAVLGAVALHPPTFLLVLCSAYLFSGPVHFLWGRAVGRSRDPRAGGEHAPAADVADEPAYR
jgi:CDP-diacylglycerol--serine O-phosphatidyltransferase